MNLLARYAPPGLDLDKLAERGRGVVERAPMPPSRPDAQQLAQTEGAGVLAQISDAARSMFQQMREQGISSFSFDLELDIEQIRLSVDASGNRSVEGRSLSIDLHVEGSQGTFAIEDGEFSFGQLEISFELVETQFSARETAEPMADQPSRGLSDNLRGVGQLLDRLGQNLGQDRVGLEDLIGLAQGQLDELNGLLDQIGRQLDELSARRDEVSSGEKSRYVELTQERLAVQIQALSYQRPPAAPTPAEV
jgi:hypothetical protein